MLDTSFVDIFSRKIHGNYDVPLAYIESLTSDVCYFFNFALSFLFWNLVSLSNKDKYIWICVYILLDVKYYVFDKIWHLFEFSPKC